MERYLENDISLDLKEKMVFMGGPRQVGKTTLSFHLLGRDADETHAAYLNWDEPNVKKTLPEGTLPADQKRIVLDEIHKYKHWRNLVKGLYDTRKKKHQFLITGSAKLNYYRRGGDSLQGRYHYYRLHPFTIPELKLGSMSDVEDLRRFGGFPEPCLRQEARFWKRWQRERTSRLIREDLLSLEHVRELSQLEILVEMLNDKAGSLLSVNSIREDLNIAFETAERYLRILENLYYCYRIAPFGPKRIRALKKEQKLYLWDWSLCSSKGASFENMVASHLLKYCHFKEDTQGDAYELRYLRGSAGHEVDFVVLKNKKTLYAVECKTGAKSVSPNIKYFATRTKIPKFYQVHLEEADFEREELRTRVLPLTRFCQIEKMV